MMCVAGCLHSSVLALALCCPRATCCALHLHLGDPPQSLAGCFPLPTISWKHTGQARCSLP